MHWNNRIFRKVDGRGEEYFHIHETFHMDDGLSWTVDPKTPFGETVDDLIECLEQMLRDAKKSKDDVLDYDSK